MLETLTIEAPGRHFRNACLTNQKAPNRSTRMTPSRSCSSCASIGLKIIVPALLTMTSSRPHRSNAASTTRCTSPSLATSQRSASASTPASRSVFSAASPRASSNSAMTTRAPFVAERRAVARPMPPPAPVTMATLSLKRMAFSALMRRAFAAARRVVRLAERRRRELLVLRVLGRRLLLARREDRHAQADALRRQHAAPFADDLAVGLADRSDAAVEVEQAERVDAAVVLAQRACPSRPGR